MARSRGRAPRGQRCVASVPQGHWKTTTFVGALRHDQLIAPMVPDGPMDGALFLAYVRGFLVPALRPGDMVVLDNLSSHKVAGVRASHRSGRRDTALSAALFARPESHRKALRQVQGPAP